MANWELKWTKLELFNEANIQRLSEVPGVYRLSYQAKDKDSNKYVFFVGKSEGIKSQLLKHLQSEEKICLKNFITTCECYFRYAQISQEEVRDAAQRQVCKYYQPSCNDSVPDGNESIIVNVT